RPAPPPPLPRRRRRPRRRPRPRIAAAARRITPVPQPRPHPRALRAAPAAPGGERQDRAAGGGKAEEAEAAGRRPWNLRPRRAANPPPPPLPWRNGESFPDAAYGAFGGDKENYAQPPQPKSVRLRGFAEEGERKEKRKFWISLSKEEIEEDIFIMTGSRPARRPRKRPKNEQKQLDIVFPGLWLVGLTADAYRVAEAPAKR
ncbi:uncharacterized protein LOC115666593, partial [Syzygium oleosum]|uniref:uncharacterized protein LOC115666593 n=1 Tax=Syzygium oleosum TaxID=219896 RepID=UPI0024B967D4